MRKHLAKLLCACLCLAVSQLFAQNHTVTGKVTDEKGFPLNGVTVTARTRSLQFSYIGLDEQVV